MTKSDRQQILSTLVVLERKLQRLYGTAYVQCLGLSQVKVAVENGDDNFDWDKYPTAKKQMENILKKLTLDTTNLINSVANNNASSAVKNVQKPIVNMLGRTREMADELEIIRKDATNKYREQSKERSKERGLDISRRVWGYNDASKKEMQIIIQNGIKEGKSADDMTRDVNKYLINPDALYRRVRNKETGKLELSDAAKNYHPGVGVYRSAYKNALRLARTEVNMAYREAEWMRYQNDPTIKCYEVRLSNHHTTLLPNGGEAMNYHDICDRLAGVYPKTFKFVGWHPQCRCMLVPVPLTPSEFGEYIKAKKDGKENLWEAKQDNIELPKGYRQWINDNHDRIVKAKVMGKKMPYFIKDNYKDGDIDKGLVIDVLSDAQRILLQAKARHEARTQEQIDDIKKRWQEHKDREKIRIAAEKRHAERTQEQVQEVINKRNAELAQFAAWEKAIKDTEIRAKANTWITDEESNIWVDGPSGTKYHLDKYYITAKALSDRMDVIDLMRPEWNKAAAHKSVFGVYQDKLDEARRMITNGFKQKATDVLKLMSEIEVLEPRYVDMRSYQSAHPGKGGKKSKIEVALDEAEELIKNGDIKGAEIKIADAEKTRKINEASALAKAEAARKKKEEEERKKAEEEERKKQGVKDLSKANSAQELFNMLGDERPVMLENYEKSIARSQWTKGEYIKNADEIERKLKEFFDGCDYAHRVSHKLLEDTVGYRDWVSGRNIDGDGIYLRDGIPTNLQVNAEGAKLFGNKNWSLKDPYYDDERRAYGHFAFGYQDKQTKVQKSKYLADNEYYRCGTPVKKDDVQNAWEKGGASAYGDTQIILRKENVVATFTYGNSLQQNTIPSLVCDPKVCSIDSKNFAKYRDSKYSTMEQIMGSKYDYLELQYLPLKSNGQISPKDWKSVTFPSDPKGIMSKGALDRLYDYGVDVYYADAHGKVVLYKKGKPQITHAEAKVKLDNAKKELENLFNNEYKLSNKDISIKTIKDKINNGDYIGALEDFEKYNNIEIRKTKIKAFIPDADKWHKQFNIDELEAAYKAIEAKIDYMDNTFKARNSAEDVLKKWEEEIDKAENPSKYKAGAKRFSTWEIARDAYVRKRNELVYEYHKTAIDSDLKILRDFNTNDKRFLAKLKDIEVKVSAKQWADVESLISDAQDIMKGLGERILKLGESAEIKFSEDEFTAAKRNAAKWFKDPDVKKAYKEADDYMSKYAQDMWKNLSDEEKHILWLYSDGSKYINDEMLGTYSLKCISPFDGTTRNGLADANIITSIIEKAPALKDAMWMQSGKSLDAFKAMFGVDVRNVNDLSSLVGKEGYNGIFSSCHASSDGYFTKGGSTGASNPIVMSIYMPAGTKGVYMEPFASYGDNLRWKKGLSWTGTKRREAPSDQVEFLLQRGAKFKITNAYYKNGKWYIDVDLIAQTAVDALNTNIPGLMNRYARISRKPTLI